MKCKNFQFDLLHLHDPRDNTAKRCLRAFTVLPKFCGFSDKRNARSEEIISMLKKIDKRAKRRFGHHWRKKWIRKIGLKIKYQTTGDWIRGKTSIPLIALKKLKEMGYEREIKEIVGKVTHVCSSTREIGMVPKKIDDNILYLTGLLLSDGYLQKTKRKDQETFEYGIYVYSGDKLFLKEQIKPIFESLFDLSEMKLTYRHQAWTLSERNKVIFMFFTRLMGLSYRKKSITARIPRIVWGIGPEKAIPFLAGLIDGDIGKHGGSMGGTFASEEFVDDVILFLDKIGVKSNKRKQNVLKSGHIQNEFYIPKKQVVALKEIMTKSFLPKSSSRLKTLFCRDTKVV